MTYLEANNFSRHMRAGPHHKKVKDIVSQDTLVGFNMQSAIGSTPVLELTSGHHTDANAQTWGTGQTCWVVRSRHWKCAESVMEHTVAMKPLSSPYWSGRAEEGVRLQSQRQTVLRPCNPTIPIRSLYYMPLRAFRQQATMPTQVCQAITSLTEALTASELHGTPGDVLCVPMHAKHAFESCKATSDHAHRSV